MLIDMPALNMIFGGGIIPLYRHVVNMDFEIDQCATGSGAARQRYREVPLPGNKSKLMVTTVLPVGETFLVTFDVQKSLAP
ncbi:MAG: hypothetical protein OEZ39_17650, partial [Gammaproteobacteria bacterium]|nr:hypothetical protein [Gammaproteobacteria bacterium]